MKIAIEQETPKDSTINPNLLIVGADVLCAVFGLVTVLPSGLDAETIVVSTGLFASAVVWLLACWSRRPLAAAVIVAVKVLCTGYAVYSLHFVLVHLDLLLKSAMFMLLTMQVVIYVAWSLIGLAAAISLLLGASGHRRFCRIGELKLHCPEIC